MRVAWRSRMSLTVEQAHNCLMRTCVRIVIRS
jgi:hypothetical protein